MGYSEGIPTPQRGEVFTPPQSVCADSTTLPSKDPATALQIQAEHIAFLRELLASKNSWYEQLLKEERQRYQDLCDTCDRLMSERGMYREVLARAVEVIRQQVGEDDSDRIEGYLK